MRKIFMVALLFVAVALTGCGEDSKLSDGFLKKDTLRIGIDDSFAPMGFRDEKGEIVGFEVDLAKEVARRLNVKVEFIPINWDNKKEEITSRRVDMIWNGLDITNERKEYMIFSKPYFDNRQLLFVKKGKNQKIISESDLEGKSVGTQAGSNAEDYINENKQLKNSFKEFRAYSNYFSAFRDLENEKIDVLICDEIVGRYEVFKHAGMFKVIEIMIGPATEIGIGFSKDNTELRDKVQIVFDEMVKDGTARKISEQWFQADVIKRKK